MTTYKSIFLLQLVFLICTIGSQTCPTGEEYTTCIESLCRDVSCTKSYKYLDANDKNCTPGCVCLTGTVRSSKGTCVNKNLCGIEDTCKDNEEFTECIQNRCQIEDCSQRGQLILCAPVPQSACEPGCVCRSGYFKDDTERCFPESECPITCPNDEEYSNCTQSADRLLTCAEKDPNSFSSSSEECTSGCICQSGYLRAVDGSCVPENQCYGNLTCTENEIANSCPGDCNDYCPASSNDTKRSCYAIQQDSKLCGQPRCTCRFNYRRDPDSGTCIPTRECPPFECNDGPNEEYNPCPPFCPTDDCEQATPTGRCPIIGRIGIVVECQPTCRCIEGYFRKNGTCVPYIQCLTNCGSNEEFLDCTQAVCRAQNCSQQGQQTECPDPSDTCEPGCICVEGTLRNESGTCVPQEQCPLICGTNEEISECTQAICTAQNCSQLGQSIPCADVSQELCEQGCVCVDGTLRNKSGVCVPKLQCPNPCGENEALYDCTSSCDVINCPESFNEEQEFIQNCVAPAVCLPPQCQCVPGYRRNNGTCIPLASCPNICGSNEQFSQCTQILCRAQNCTQLGQLIACPALAQGSCEQGCVCVEGTLRDESGACVPQDQCPNPCDENEILKECPNGCDVTNCPESFAQEQEFRQNCVAPAVCLPPQCQCVSGYRKDDNGTCIPLASCPNICGTNEEFSECTQGGCGAKNCSQLGQPEICPNIIKGSCEQGCVCVEGTLRNESGACVPQEQCPNPCDENEVLNKCPNACDVTCCPESFAQEQEFRQNCVAAAVCLPPQCQCVSGYRRDDNGTCIPLASCPNICGSNEEFSECTQAVCRAENCSQLGQPIACPALAQGSCEQGCVCEEGTLRDESGACVPQDQCPNPCDENEILKECPNGCDVTNCPESFAQEQEFRQNCVAPAVCLPPQCQCVSGYRKDDNGTCIPLASCPNICGTNEEFSECTQGGCGAKNCSQLGQPEICPNIIQGSCEQGCVCVEGTLGNESGACVPQEQCPNPCDENEVLNECPNACDVTCCPESFAQEQEFRQNCVAAAVCLPPQCQCVSGYRRDDNGTCIPLSSCPNICGSNEEFSECTQAVCRAENCSQLGQPIACPALAQGSCEQGCVCEEGTLRDESGACVPQDQCPNPCDENEILKECPNGCDVTNCPESFAQEQEFRQNCVAPAVCLPPQCQCVSGYRKDDNGTCIPLASCPYICGTNEEFSECTQGGCGAKNCSQLGQPEICPNIIEGSCEQGCVCVEGTLRNESGACVPQEQCPNPCGENEVLNECPNACDVTCCPESFAQEQEFRQNCVAAAVCHPPQCQCVSGYRRGDNGTCIPLTSCPNICGSNEEFSECTQAVCRAENCSQLGQPIACPALAQGSCEQGCVCEEGTLRDESGACVPQDQCPNPCDENEILKECPNGCDVTNCPESFAQEQEFRQNCVAPAVCLPPQCQCVSGYRKDDNGTCIPLASCPYICGTNEEFSECTQGGCGAKNCSQLGQPEICPNIIEGSCEQGCVCVEGTLRNESGACVPQEQCPNPCGENEVLNECPTACDVTCCPESFAQEQEFRQNCVAAAVCLPPQCQCVSGYRRDDNGTCIPLASCPNICGSNEEFSECTQAVCRAENCSQLGQPIACPALAQGSCEQGCVCEEGTLRDESGACVPQDQCPNPCDENEILKECPNGCDVTNCPESFAQEQEFRQNCVAPAVCLPPQCQCVSGYRKDDNGTCIPLASCPNICGTNEEFSECTQGGCGAKNCSQLGQPEICPNIIQGSCEQGCVCVEGTLRNESGACVPQEQCPNPCDENEVLNECPNACDVTCCPESFAQEQEFRQNCVAATVCLPPQCQCVSGYRRGDNGNCIPLTSCPNICGSNEEFSECTQAVCRAENCSQLGQPIACPALAQGSCEQGCVCEEGTLRDESGACVPQDQCPNTCDENEILKECPNGCDVTNCPESFAQEQEFRQNCVAPAVCLPPQCQCVSGYRKDDNGTCIPLASCPNICGTNEEFSECTQGGCGAKNCSQLGQPEICPNIIEGSCEQGCVCVEGTLRNESGACVPQEQCPNPCDENEVLNKCPTACDVTCCPESFAQEQEFRQNCVAAAVCLPPQCQCVSGYRRDDNGTCIPLSSCPNICGSNEEFSECTQAVCRAENCSQLGQPIACPALAQGSCEQGCVCEEGTLRDESGACVPQDQCPNPCDENEILKECPNGCDVTNCPESFAQEQEFRQNCVAPAVCLPPQCQCVSGYRKDDNGTCIPLASCPYICGTNEEFSECTQGGCGAKNCSQLGQPEICPNIIEGSCEQGCVCVEGTLRNESGACVPQEQCPNPCGENEVLNECPNACDVTCCPESFAQEQEFRQNCVAAAVCHPPQCQCVSGYRRGDNGTCIPLTSCPNICGSNEEFSECTQAVCRAENCSQLGQPIACPALAQGSCEQGCVCVEGTLRDESGACVPEDQCQDNQCAENEVLNECPNACDVTCCPESFAQEQEFRQNCVAATVCLPPQCQCVSGYRRDDNGTCIPFEACFTTS